MAAAADGVARESANLAAGERGGQQLALSDALRRTLLGLSDAAESYGATSIATLAMRMARSPMERPAERIAIQAFAHALMDRELSRLRAGRTHAPADRHLARAMQWRRHARRPVPPAEARPHSIGRDAGAAAPVAPPAAPPRPSRRQPRDHAPVRAAPSCRPRRGSRATRRTERSPAIGCLRRLVPIESLLYRGPEALARARVVRDALREAWQRVGGTSIDPVAASLLDELSDLLDLAAAE
jgi:hypothetical protein